jgi:diguanylate cyclase (GGDEF)-like protein
VRTILKSWGSSRRRACDPSPPLRELLEISTDPLLTLDGEGRVTGANAAARALLGCDPAGWPIGRYVPAWRDLAAGGGLAAVAGRVHELTAVRESAREFPAEARLSLGPGDGPALLHLRDVTERARRQAELERLALHDALTGLPNRLLLDDRLRHGLLHAQRRGEPLAVMLLDLNGFKHVNDTLGHHVGDRLLQQLAPRLATPLRKSDTLARLGGDEFAVLLAPPTDLEQAGQAAERLVAALAEPFTVDGARLEVGASVGVALYPDHGVEASELLRRADAAMYAAKRSGLGFAVCDDREAGDVLRRRGLRRDLQEAIENDGLTLLFQPKVQARGGHELAGAEALVAWRHPEHGLLSAPDFLPLAEQTGLVLP